MEQAHQSVFDRRRKALKRSQQRLRVRRNRFRLERPGCLGTLFHPDPQGVRQVKDLAHGRRSLTEQQGVQPRQGDSRYLLQLIDPETAPVHDALLVEAPLDQLDTRVAVTREAMAEASRIVLGGFEIRTGVELVRYPGRYMDARGAEMWATVMGLLGKDERRAA